MKLDTNTSTFWGEMFSFDNIPNIVFYIHFKFHFDSFKFAILFPTGNYMGGLTSSHLG